MSDLVPDPAALMYAQAIGRGDARAVAEAVRQSKAYADEKLAALQVSTGPATTITVDRVWTDELDTQGPWKAYASTGIDVSGGRLTLSAGGTMYRELPTTEWHPGDDLTFSLTALSGGAGARPRIEETDAAGGQSGWRQAQAGQPIDVTVASTTTALTIVVEAGATASLTLEKVTVTNHSQKVTTTTGTTTGTTGTTTTSSTADSGISQASLDSIPAV